MIHILELPRLSTRLNFLQAAALNILTNTIKAQNGFILPVCISKSSQFF